jgi:hypothetical protein
MRDVDKRRVERIGAILHHEKGLLCKCGKDDCRCCQRQFLYDVIDKLLRQPSATSSPPRTR